MNRKNNFSIRDSREELLHHMTSLTRRIQGLNEELTTERSKLLDLIQAGERQLASVSVQSVSSEVLDSSSAGNTTARNVLQMTFDHLTQR